jgi:hypothetical protein
MEYISLSWYSRACGSYQDFLDRGLLLTRKLLNHGFLLVKLKSSLFTAAIVTWLTVMEYMCHKWPRICSTCRKHFPVLSSFMTYRRVCSLINATGVTSGAGTAYPSGAPEFIPDFQWGSCNSIFSFICMFYRSLFVLLYFFYLLLCCLFFFDIQILITPLVSSNSSRYSEHNLRILPLESC